MHTWDIRNSLETCRHKYPLGSAVFENTMLHKYVIVLDMHDSGHHLFESVRRGDSVKLQYKWKGVKYTCDLNKVYLEGEQLNQRLMFRVCQVLLVQLPGINMCGQIC